METMSTALMLLHGIPVIGVIILSAFAMHFKVTSLSAVNGVASRNRLLLTAAFVLAFIMSAMGLFISIRTRWSQSHIDDDVTPIPIVVGESFRVKQQQPIGLAATYGSTPLYSPVSVVANANYSCFSGTTPLSCAAWFCNMSTTIANEYQTRSCEMNGNVVNYVAKVAAISKKTCTQSTNARCTTAALTALFGKFDGVFAAYCTDSFLVIISSGKSRTQSYNLDNIPYPPGGNDATGACRTRTASITDQLIEAGIPLVPVPLPTAAYANNKNTNVWPLGAVVSIIFYHC